MLLEQGRDVGVDVIVGLQQFLIDLLRIPQHQSDVHTRTMRHKQHASATGFESRNDGRLDIDALAYCRLHQLHHEGFPYVIVLLVSNHTFRVLTVHPSAACKHVPDPRHLLFQCYFLILYFLQLCVAGRRELLQLLFTFLTFELGLTQGMLQGFKLV